MTETMEMTPIQKLKRDVSKASVTLSIKEIRYLVDNYYSLQEYRKAAANQERALAADKEPHEVISWLRDQTATLESQIKGVLDKWTDSHLLSKWFKATTGIGPVIAAGMAAHIDITKAPTVGHIWRFAGLDPTQSWSKGEKRPWNASLRRLSWICGESFVKFSNNEKDNYGKYWATRKDLEIKRNEAGQFAEQAKAKLEKFKIGKTTDAYASYSQGQLPPAHIHARAKRYAVKLMYSHYHEAAYFIHYNKLPPKPYVIAILGHADYIHPPNMHLVPGWAEAHNAPRPVSE